MFNREYRDMEFIPRWQIVRKIRTQYLSGHSYLVAMYANDICALLGVDDETHLLVLQYALWHDVDEVFSGDFPGPAKRALVPDRTNWKAKVDEWMTRCFGFWTSRGGYKRSKLQPHVEAIVKCADWLDAACEMATEYQMGNQLNVMAHMQHDKDMALRAAVLAVELWKGSGPEARELCTKLSDAITKAVNDCRNRVSEGPLTDPIERGIAASAGLLSRSS